MFQNVTKCTNCYPLGKTGSMLVFKCLCRTGKQICLLLKGVRRETLGSDGSTKCSWWSFGVVGYEVGSGAEPRKISKLMLFKGLEDFG